MLPEQTAALRAFLTTLDLRQLAALVDVLGQRVEDDREAAELDAPFGPDLSAQADICAALYEHASALHVELLELLGGAS